MYVHCTVGGRVWWSERDSSRWTSSDVSSDVGMSDFVGHTNDKLPITTPALHACARLKNRRHFVINNCQKCMIYTQYILISKAKQ